jgi:nucleotidyltransferase substrate binding protein (TIGR01987 family)
MNQDIRWKQRFSNYQKAHDQLKKFIEHGKLNEFEEQGLIQAFEYTYELAWNVMNDLLTYQGESGILGSRDAIRTAFRRNLILDGEGWMSMVESRIKSRHTYNEIIASEIAKKITNVYFQLFTEFRTKVESVL